MMIAVVEDWEWGYLESQGVMNDDSHKDVLRILVSFDNAILWYIKTFLKGQAGNKEKSLFHGTRYWLFKVASGKVVAG